jgi:RimJ/RimL family protein N-acetyltransferase
MQYPERLETDSLLLRRWRSDDAEAMRALWSDPEVWAALGGAPDGDSREVAQASLRRQLGHWDRHGFGLWAVVPHGERGPVGWAGGWFQDIAPALDGEIEIGWTLRRAFWGRGLATEAAGAAIAAVFELLSPARLISLIAPANERSAAVARRLGMRQDSETLSRTGLPLRVFALAASGEQAYSSSRGASPQSTSSR